MSEIKICGIVLCSLIICVVFKSIKSEYSLFIRLAITVALSLISLSIIYPILSYVDKISKGAAIYEYLPLLIKSMGIAFAVQITSDICKDAGEHALGERVCLFGRAEILVISLPLIKSLFQLCEKLLV